MKATVIKYALRAGITLVILSWLTFFITKSMGVTVAQVGSILAIIVALGIFCPMAIKSLRTQNGGTITFWEAFFTAALTCIGPALFMFASTIIFMLVQRANYTEWAESADMAEGTRVVVMNPVEQGVIMFIIIMFLGAITSAISAVVLYRANPK